MNKMRNIICDLFYQLAFVQCTRTNQFVTSQSAVCVGVLFISQCMHLACRKGTPVQKQDQGSTSGMPEATIRKARVLARVAEDIVVACRSFLIVVKSISRTPHYQALPFSFKFQSCTSLLLVDATRDDQCEEIVIFGARIVGSWLQKAIVSTNSRCTTQSSSIPLFRLFWGSGQENGTFSNTFTLLPSRCS